jgi:hypothetical protein
VLVTPSDAATLKSVAKALRNFAVPRWRILWFLLLHILLAPLTRLSRSAHDPGPALAAAKERALDERIVGAGSHLFVIPGAAIADSRTGAAAQHAAQS